MVTGDEDALGMGIGAGHTLPYTGDEVLDRYGLDGRGDRYDAARSTEQI